MSDEQIEVHGSYDPVFEPVRDAFAANFTERGDIGASVAVVVHGAPKVNIGPAGPILTGPGPGNATPSPMSGPLPRP